MVSPRHYQRKAIVELEEARREGKDAGLLNMATGTGKTLTTAFDIKNYMNSSNKVLFLAHQKEILEQAEKEYQRIGKHNSSFYAGYKTNKSGKVVYATRDKMYNNLDQFDPEEFDYIIVDECHHVQSPTYQKITDYFNPEFLLGLTATPYLLGVNKQDILRELGIEEETFKYTSKEAVNDGWLSETKAHIFKDNLDLEDVTEEKLDKKVFLPERNQKIVQAWKEKANDRKTITFCRNIEHANRIANKFKSEGVDAEAIHSNLSDDLREKYIQQFRNGELDVLTGVNIFNEGVDFPNVSCLLFLRPTISRRIFTQQLGRGLRSNGNDQKCLVLDFVNQFTWERLQNQYGVDMDDLQGNVESDSENVRVMTDVGEIEIEEDLVFDALEEYERWKSMNPTTEEVKEDLLSVIEEFGRAITSVEYREHGEYTPATIRRHLGKWNESMKELGYKPLNTARDATKEEVIEDLKEANSKTDGSITKKEYRELGSYSTKVVENRLGCSWNKAKQEVGIELDPIQRYTTDTEEMVQKLRSFAEDKDIVKKSEFEKEYNCSAQSIIEKFGSWVNALEEIGVKPHPSQRGKVKKEELLKDLRRVEEEVDGKLSSANYEKYGKFTDATAEKLCGSWVQAKEEAGVELFEGDKFDITKEYILEKIREVDEKIPDDKVVTSDRWNEHTKHDAKVVNARFDSWYDVREQAGVTNINPDHGGGLIPEESILKDLRKTAEEVEGRLTSSYYAKNGKYSDTAVFSRYDGNWKKALKEAGLKQYDVSRQEILEDIKEKAEEVDGKLTIAYYDEHGIVSTATVANRFGSWTEGKKEAGVYIGNYKITTKEIIEDMREVSEDGKLSGSKYGDEGEYSPTVATRRFGSWRKALDEAGLGPVKYEWDEEEVIERIKKGFKENPGLKCEEFIDGQPFSMGVLDSGWRELKKREDIKEIRKQKILEDFQKMYEETGETSQRAFDEYVDYPAGTARRLFGSWTKVKEIKVPQVELSS